MNDGVAGELGFEPRLTESESAVLPLNYSPPDELYSNMFFKSFTNHRQEFYKLEPLIGLLLLGLAVFGHPLPRLSGP